MRATRSPYANAKTASPPSSVGPPLDPFPTPDANAGGTVPGTGESRLIRELMGSLFGDAEITRYVNRRFAESLTPTTLGSDPLSAAVQEPGRGETAGGRSRYSTQADQVGGAGSAWAVRGAFGTGRRSCPPLGMTGQAVIAVVVVVVAKAAPVPALAVVRVVGVVPLAAPVLALDVVGVVGVVPIAAPRALVALVALRLAARTVMALLDAVPLVALRSVVIVMAVVAEGSLARDRIRRFSAPLLALVPPVVPAVVPPVVPAVALAASWGRGDDRLRVRGAPGLRYYPQPVRHGQRQCSDHQQDE